MLKEYNENIYLFLEESAPALLVPAKTMLRFRWICSVQNKNDPTVKNSFAAVFEH